MKKAHIIAFALCIGVTMGSFSGCSNTASGVNAEPIKQTRVSSSNVVQTPETSYWDECYLTYGLMAKTVTMTAQEQNALSELLFNYPLQEAAQNNPAPQNIRYGGPFYRAKFVKDGICYEWYLCVNGFTKTVTQNGSIIEQIVYEVDYALFQKLDELR